MSQDSFGHVRQTAKTDVPALPASEKTDITLRAEALAAVALTLARVQLKKKTEPDEAALALATSDRLLIHRVWVLAYIAQDDVLRDASSKCCECYVAVAGRKCSGGFVL